jgi:uncharacterized protein
MCYIEFMITTPQKKTGYINTRVAPALKAEAENVLERLGVSTTEAITMFLSQVVLQQALPFLVRIPNAETAAALREAKQNPEIRKTYEGVEAMMKDIRPLPPLDAQTQHAAKTFLKHISSRYPFREALLFGSRARNTHTDQSDADIAIVLKAPHGDRAAAVKDMAAIAFHVMMETGVMVEALPLWADEVEHPETFSNPALINNILREGIRL